MKKTICILYFILNSTWAFACDYQNQSGCYQEQRCIYLKDPTTPICFDKFLENYPQIEFPFSSARVVTCDQGPHMPGEQIHSHAWINAMDALDLRTDDRQAPANIYAGLSGVAVIHDSCTEFNTNCGAGFGNHVKIFNKNGYIAFYAHLERVFVKNGAVVEAGQLVGLEGNTGLTGKNNRHLHMSVHYDWRMQGIEYWSKLGWLPRSIPFSFDVFNTISSMDVVTKNTKTVKCIRRKENKFFEAALRGTKSP